MKIFTRYFSKQTRYNVKRNCQFFRQDQVALHIQEKITKK